MGELLLLLSCVLVVAVGWWVYRVERRLRIALHIFSVQLARIDGLERELREIRLQLSDPDDPGSDVRMSL